MDVNEVPQESSGFKQRDQVRKLMYAVGKDGQYTGVNSAGWEPEHVAMQQAWEEADETVRQTLDQVLRGEQSPIAYFMQKHLMTPALLGKYVGKWGWQVRRHLKPAVFQRLPSALLERYARVFNITMDELIHFGQHKHNGEQ